jgi:hypothetical protein
MSSVLKMAISLFSRETHINTLIGSELLLLDTIACGVGTSLPQTLSLKMSQES